MAFEPVIDGLRTGGLVEIHDLDESQNSEYEKDVNGDLGQIVSYADGKFYVQLVSGIDGHFEPKNVRVANDRKKPGEGGHSESFDMLVAPKTDPAGLGEEIAVCLLEKGFCVLKVCQSTTKMEPTIDKLRELGEEGKLTRLPEEVEEGYLGTNCKGKVAWLDADDRDFSGDGNLWAADELLSYIAGLFQPFSGDTLGEFTDERTPALLCLSLTDEEEPEFPFPEAEDKTLGAFLETWRRTLLRVVSYLGPGTASVQLESRDTPKAQALPKAQSSIDITANANTIVLFRPDVYEYTCEASEETLMLVSSLLSAAPIMQMGEVSGDTEWLLRKDGPPKPPGDNHIYVLNSVSRLPGCFDNQWAYWTGIKAATDTVIKIPLMRGDIDPYFTTNEDTYETWQTTSQHIAFVEGAEMFDNKHFEISTAEAAGMDPVQRLIMEAGSQSLAMIGLTKKITNRKSVHAGFAVGNDKLDWCAMPKEISIGAACGGTSTVLAIIANRFSFVFNFKGPSYVCDTACSASLTSTHCAKMMMMDRKVDPLEFFISMGAHLVLQPVNGNIGGTQSHMGGPIGRCLTFNASASGYLRGEGISGILLKYGNYKGASDAILRATQVGQDGRSASLTAPNGPAQEEMISRAIKEAQMTPPESTVWECHGTGTSLGDPIEVGAVRKVQIRMQRLEPLMLTSNKTNIGHLEGGAAMGAICKCVLQCKYAKCCPTLHLRTLNPHLEHAAFDAIFQTEGACYAYLQGHSQVSSFGFGGSNGHGVFWGENTMLEQDVNKMWQKKLAERPPPEVRVIGKSYDEWEADFPDLRSVKSGTKFQIRLGEKDPVDQPVRWEMVEGGPEEEEEEDVFYAISGNFNDWADDRMSAGDVPGVHSTTIEIPDSGVLEFRFLKDGDENKVLCPATDDCGRKMEKIVGPDKGLANKWKVFGRAGEDLKIELFIKGGMKSLMWMAERS